MRRMLAVLALALALAGPAAAQEKDFTPEEDALLADCLDGARAASQGLDTCIGAASEPCMATPEGATTVGMSECMASETAWWDRLLNARYRELRDTIDTESFAALRDAQRAWVAFRDAECGFRHTYWRDGTIRSTFYASCMLDLTARRAIDLEHVANWAL